MSGESSNPGTECASCVDLRAENARLLEMVDAFKEVERRFQIVNNAVRGTMRYLEGRKHIGRGFVTKEG